MIIGETRADAPADLVTSLEVKTFPTLFAITGDTSAGEPPTFLKYDGEFKTAAVSTFLTKHAAPPPSARSAAAALAVSLTKDNIDEQVSGSDPWIILFGSAAQNAEKIAETVWGQVKVGVAEADLGGVYGVDGDGVAVLKHGASSRCRPRHSQIDANLHLRPAAVRTSLPHRRHREQACEARGQVRRGRGRDHRGPQGVTPPPPGEELIANTRTSRARWPC